MIWIPAATYHAWKLHRGYVRDEGVPLALSSVGLLILTGVIARRRARRRT